MSNTPWTLIIVSIAVGLLFIYWVATSLLKYGWNETRDDIKGMFKAVIEAFKDLFRSSS